VAGLRASMVVRNKPNATMPTAVGCVGSL
jgi:hypothetical protein